MLEELERAYRGVQSYGLTLPGRIVAHLYGSAAEFVRGSGGSSYNLALASGEELHMQPLRILRRHGDPARVLTHELTHIALEGAARRGLPRWFNEGITMNLAGERQPETFRFRRLDQLADSLAHSRSYRVVRSAYGTSERLVRSLAADYGRERLLQLCRNVAAGRGFDEEFRRLTGGDPRSWAVRQLGNRKGKG
jgi:hypothetical protein